MAFSDNSERPEEDESEAMLTDFLLKTSYFAGESTLNTDTVGGTTESLTDYMSSNNLSIMADLFSDWAKLDFLIEDLK